MANPATAFRRRLASFAEASRLRSISAEAAVAQRCSPGALSGCRPEHALAVDQQASMFPFIYAQTGSQSGVREGLPALTTRTNAARPRRGPAGWLWPARN